MYNDYSRFKNVRFLLKGSVSFVAKELYSSEASIYRYLGKLNSRSGK